MKKISFFGLVLSFMAMAIFIVSCSQPLYPDGSTYRPGGGNTGGRDIPGWDTDGSSPCGRMTVAEQLQWLRTNPRAAAGTVWYVWAWMTPHETIHLRQDIHGVGGLGTAITVNLRTYRGYPGPDNRRRLLLDSSDSGPMTMLSVLDGNTLILENIILQGRDNNGASLVVVSAGTLKKGNDSEIRGHDGILESAAVSANAGATFTMSGNARITNSNTGVFVSGAYFHMNEEARITANNLGVAVRQNGNFIMSTDASIYGNNTGVHASDSGRVYMNDDANIRNNAERGAVISFDSVLIMLDYAEIRHNYCTGVSLSSGGQLFMYDYAAIHNNISTSAGGVWVEGYSHIHMYGNASIHSNFSYVTTGTDPGSIRSGGVTLSALGLVNYNSLRMHGNARIWGNSTNSTTAGGGVTFLGGNARLYISGGTIYGTLQEPSTSEPDYYNKSDGTSFHAVRNANNTNNLRIAVYLPYNSRPTPVIGRPGTLSFTVVNLSLPHGNGANNNTIRVWDNGTNDNSSDW